MPHVSQQKKDKIAEQILHFLFSQSPQAHFTSTIATELARDEEFIKAQLEELEKKKAIICITKNKEGTPYSLRKRWRLADKVYALYKQKQNSSSHPVILHTPDVHQEE
ncbi:hypothetical protein FJZ22_02850 [Candidatus Pacearchaeota archaeon]|nr:hypothetical protein [Candidatus Pacearchaeota archaeon]